MKAFLTGVAFIILLTFFNSFQIEQDAYLRAQEYMKVMSDDMAGAAVLFVDEGAFSQGKKVYQKNKSEQVLKNLAMANLDLKSDLSPKATSYWDKPVSYTSYYFDDTGYMTIYKNGQYTGRESFTYGSVFTDPQTQYKKLITEASVIVTMKAEYPVYKANWVTWPQITRSSAYEDLDRN